ncbi:hypothetical protein [Novosphingobium sp. 9U]|uniref:hypothetical protein n=1 Tax=Novosphingobium sp. 9U TaxID=2653158 RepID=UPI0012EFEA0B|nr:hypothetical protein [Novosphingobium sp. 9U]VWX46631.1 conserved hypothetical protein [Novosphingobium sp. 9U]
MHIDETPLAPLTADTTGSNVTLESYDIAPEDQELADSITNFDPYNTPSPISGEGGFKTPERFTARMLPDGMRAEVEQKLVGIPAGEARDRKESELALEAMRKNSLGLRVRLGLGAGANAYQRAAFDLQRDLEKLQGEADGIMTQLGDVTRWDVVDDPDTGGKVNKPVYSVDGPNRRALELRHAEIVRHIGALDGVEGDRRLQRARYQAVQDHKAVQSQLRIMSAAKERAAGKLEEEEIERLASAFASNRRNHLG